MPWAQFEPLEVKDRERLIDHWHETWKRGDDFNFGVFDKDRLVGGCGLHPGFGDQVLAIGYWTRSTAVRGGVATEAVRCLIEAAFSIPTLDSVQIHHHVDNVGSRRIPERLGFSLVGEGASSEGAAFDNERLRVWRLDREQWARREQLDGSPPDPEPDLTP